MPCNRGMYIPTKSNHLIHILTLIIEHIKNAALLLLEKTPNKQDLRDISPL